MQSQQANHAGSLTLPEQNAETADKNAVTAICRKFDFALLPLLVATYLCNGLDRGNVGNAETQNFTKDIGVLPDDLNLAVSLFYVTFVTLQPISAGLGRKIGPARWIPILQFCWGICTILQAFVRGKGGLISVRLLLGAFEAGFYPTAVNYISTFYTKYELGTRIAIFYGMYAVANAFSGVISFGIFQIRSSALRPWQLLFVIEGAVTCAVAIIAAFWLPSGPESAWFLSLDDRILASRRIQHDLDLGGDAGDGSRSGLSKKDVTEALKEWKLWFVFMPNLLASVPGQALSTFLPLVVKGLGYSSVEANLMSTPPYVCGALCLFAFALHSDRRKERAYHIIGGLLLTLIGTIITVSTHHHGVQYAGLCILLSGTFISAPLTIAWLANNTIEPGKRSIILGLNGFGNLSGIIGAQLFRNRFAPTYRTPFLVCLSFIVVSILGYIAYRQALASVNRRRGRLLSRMTPEEIAEAAKSIERYGDKKITFVYGL